MMLTLNQLSKHLNIAHVILFKRYLFIFKKSLFIFKIILLSSQIRENKERDNHRNRKCEL
jgi:hypothetical protein